MVTDEQREQIAEVPAETLNRIMRLPEPTFEAVNDALPGDYQYLAQPILDILLGDDGDDSAPEVEVKEPSPDAGATAAAAPSPEPVAAPDSRSGDPLQDAIKQAIEKTMVQRRFRQEDVIDYLSPDNFPPYQWGADVEGAPGVAYEVLGDWDNDADDGEQLRVELEWNEYGSDTVKIYRIVSTKYIDNIPSPDTADHLAFTKGTFYEDPVPADEAYREYQVWAYTGPDAETMLQAQPELVGRILVVFPVTGIKLTPGEGAITGTWNALPGHHLMRVYVSNDGDPERPDNSQYLQTEGVQPMRFQYVTEERGVVKRVVLQPEVKRPDGSIVLGPTSPEKRIEIKGELVQTNFNAVFHENTPQGPKIRFSIYGPPAGDFHVYLTRSKPNQDLTVADMPKEALSQEGLDASDNVHQQFGSIGHNEEFASDLFWPQDWDEVFVTPVVTLGSYARVGESVALHHVDEIGDAEIREFVGYQLVTFGWPRGASMVKVERQPEGATAEDRETVREFTEENYRQNGGVKLQLDSGGEDVVLTPQKYYADAPTMAEETIVSYPGLRKYLYTMYLVTPTAHHPGGLELRIWSDGQETRNPPNFAVVFNPDRKPLSAEVLSAGDVRLGATPGAPAFHASTGIILTPDHIGNSEEKASVWFIPADQFPADRDTVQGFLRVMMLRGDAEEGQIRHIITDEASNGGLLFPDTYEQMITPPAIETPEPQQGPQKKRGLFGGWG